MRAPSIFVLAGVLVAVPLVAIPLAARERASARCTYAVPYPDAIGRHTYVLATATATQAPAPVDTPIAGRKLTASAQLMRVDDVAGYYADEVRRALRTGGRQAIFVRYGVSASCHPYPLGREQFDSAGTNGLYAGRVRPRDEWVGGRPAFDIFDAPHFPLPLRRSAPGRYGSATDTAATMTATELFTMYRALWTDSADLKVSSIAPRVQRLLREHPRVARKPFTVEMAAGLFEAAHERPQGFALPFPGVYAVSVVVPGVDSLNVFVRIAHNSFPVTTDFERDRTSRLPISVRRRVFAFNLTTSATLAGVSDSRAPIDEPCLEPVVQEDRTPIAFGPDSSWQGLMYPIHFLSCATRGSKIEVLSRTLIPQTVGYRQAPVRFRQLADGRITFSAESDRVGNHQIIVHAERVSPAN